MGLILTRKAINKTFTDCSKVDSSLALRVSCLNFEPWSQSFPVILSKMANITIATIKVFSIALRVRIRLYYKIVCNVLVNLL